MKKFIKICLIILVIFLNFTIPAFAEENTVQEDRVTELEEQKQQLEEQNQEKNEQLQFVNDEISSTLVEIAELTQSILDKQTEIDELDAKSEILEQKIKDTEKDLETATEEYNSKKELLEKRLVAMYEMGETSYLDVLLASKSISELISNYYYLSEIANADNELFTIVKEKKTKVENLMASLKEDQESLDEARSNLDKTSIALSNIVIIKNQRVASLNEQELSLQQQIEEYQSQIQAVESEIRLLSLLTDNSEYVGGSFLWPVPGYTRISSQFGMRTHPITGVYKLHTGVDIAAPMGSTFIASNNGVVTKAGFNAAYGNMVIIDHGGGISTLYAHGLEILVQEGQVVNAGTPVLKVGSTGYSTGPHAHFEIRINGTYVNPLDYLIQEQKADDSSNTETVEIN